MLKILVVDDSPMTAGITGFILRKAGYSVDTATTGEDGVKMASRWRYDLIIMDMDMPGIGGGEATQLIRDAEKASGTRRVPVLAFTSNVTEVCRRRAMRSDMDDFLTKPVSVQFLSTVERSVDNRSIFLVADDRTHDRERTLRYLRALDRVGVVAAATGAEAIAACERQRISFALVAASLPDGGGIETAQRIRSSKNGDRIGIVVIGDKTAPEARKLSEESGHAGYLERPFGEAEIINLIRPLMVSA